MMNTNAKSTVEGNLKGMRGGNSNRGGMSNACNGMCPGPNRDNNGTTNESNSTLPSTEMPDNWSDTTSSNGDGMMNGDGWGSQS